MLDGRVLGCQARPLQASFAFPINEGQYSQTMPGRGVPGPIRSPGQAPKQLLLQQQVQPQQRHSGTLQVPITSPPPLPGANLSEPWQQGAVSAWSLPARPL